MEKGCTSFRFSIGRSLRDVNLEDFHRTLRATIINKNELKCIEITKGVCNKWINNICLSDKYLLR